MNWKLLKLPLACVAGLVIITANPRTVYAFEDGLAGFTYDKIGYSCDVPVPGYINIGYANVNDNLLIRSAAGENNKIIGKLPKGACCNILSEDENGWTKVSAVTASGKTITGYVKSQYLFTGEEATAQAKENGSYVAISKADGLRVRKEPNTQSTIIDQIAKGEELLVDINDYLVLTDDPEYPKWVKVLLDTDDEAGTEGSFGYVAMQYVEVEFKLPYALSIEEVQYGTGVSSKRVNIVNFARQYLGGRYVWGGTSLKDGVDCSGFVLRVFEKYGINLGRTSREQARGGRKISASELKPGDLVFYGSSSYINHVAIYIGNGKVIHASNKRDGIKISNMNYRRPVAYVRYIND
jgi:cell wall-associated NlpC family hydrolase